MPSKVLIIIDPSYVSYLPGLGSRKTSSEIPEEAVSEVSVSTSFLTTGRFSDVATRSNAATLSKSTKDKLGPAARGIHCRQSTT